MNEPFWRAIFLALMGGVAILVVIFAFLARLT